MLIDKDTFIDCVTAIKDFVMLQIMLDGVNINVYDVQEIINVQNKFIDLLEYVTDDKSGWIKYFMYDLGFGMVWKPGTITTFDKSDVKLETVEDLWDVLNTSEAV